MAQLIERRALEFTIESTEKLDDPQEFLGLQNAGRSDFVLYWLNEEEGDYEFASGVPDSEAELIESAIDYMVERWGYDREKLSARN
ncbi:MAG TPA: hypothetical protein VE732_05265 [Nitrososphaera sp.]|jgi:hypothetical protein|nr:hypothetical protein [Nitrososphaera sp.]